MWSRCSTITRRRRRDVTGTREPKSAEQQPNQLKGSAHGRPRANALADLFPRASERGAGLKHWAEGRFLVEHGAPKDLEERIAERFPTPEALADVVPDLEMT